MHENAALITRFYEAFSRRDADAMAACYADDIHFSDPAFPNLRGPEAGAMWKMLTSRSESGLTIEASGIEADDRTGKAHWVATYAFGPQKRPVVNRIDAAFTFRDGLIVRHVDTFDFWTWSRQALGAPGYLLGWSGFLRNKVQAQAGAQLKRFMNDG